MRRRFQCCMRPVPVNRLRGVLSNQLYRQYMAMLEELEDPNPAYCCNRACGVFLPSRLASGPDVIVCPQCARSTCRHCKGKSHDGSECAKDVAAQKARELARKKGWKACPKCASIVEKSSGCMHMVCRCSAEFCYRCGGLWAACNQRCTG